MKANAVGKNCIEVDRAYLAGLIDADGAIMALIEPHREKKFHFRVRMMIKITQKKKEDLLFLLPMLGIGSIRANRTTHDWILRDQKQISHVLSLIRPYSRMKRRQIDIAHTILRLRIGNRKDLLRAAQLADTLSRFNVRSKNRRKNYATMI